MDLFTLDYFMQIASGNTVERVAEDNYISPSSLSKAIQAFEKELGTALFIRTSRSLTLTSDGKALYDNLLPLHGRYFSVIDATMKNVRNRDIYLASYLSFTTLGLMQTLTSYERQFNDTLKLLRVTPDNAFKKLIDREFTFLLAYTAGINPKFVETPVASYDIIAILANDHPLSARQSISYDEMLSLSADPSLCSFDQALYKLLSFKYPNLNMPAGLAASTSDSISQLLYRGGVAFTLNDLRMRRFPGAVIIPVSGSPRVNLSIIHLADVPLTEKAQAFKEAIPQIYARQLRQNSILL